MLPHSRLFWFVLLVVVFLVLATALGAAAQPAPQTPAAPAVAGPVEVLAPSAQPATVLAATLLLHLVATVVGLRLGMRIFYESAMARGFVAIVLIDVLVVAGMIWAGPLCDGFSALLGPQVVVTALAMVVTLHHFGFTKDRFTVIPTVLVAKAFGFFGEVALRMLFLDALLRWAAAQGW